MNFNDPVVYVDEEYVYVTYSEGGDWRYGLKILVQKNDEKLEIVHISRIALDPALLLSLQSNEQTKKEDEDDKTYIKKVKNLRGLVATYLNTELGIKYQNIDDKDYFKSLTLMNHFPLKTNIS